MLSSRNYKERLRQMEQKNEHFSIRKLTIGAASVLIGISFLGFNAHTTNAETTDGSQANSDSDVKSDDTQSNLKIEKSSDVAETAQQNTASAAKDANKNGDSTKVTYEKQATLLETKKKPEDIILTPKDSEEDLFKENLVEQNAKDATTVPVNKFNLMASPAELNESKAAGTPSKTEKTDVATELGLNYPATEVHQGSNTVISVSNNGKTAPEGTTYSLDSDDLQAPEGVTVKVNSSTGQISVAATKAAQLANFKVPVTVTYPDKSQTPDTLTAAVTVVQAYKNTMNVTDWASFINALEDTNVDNINITHDITVTGKTGSLGGQSLGYNGCLTFTKQNVARNVTITGNGNTIDFGHYSLMFQDANQKNGNGWDITIDNTQLKGVSQDGSGKTSTTKPGQYGLISFANVNSDNQKNDSVTLNNVTASASGRAVVNGSETDHSGVYYKLNLTGNNNITASEEEETMTLTGGISGSALDAGYVEIENGTTTINVTSVYDGNNNFGGNAIRTAQTDIHNDDGSTVYTFDIKKGATLNITGGKDARGIYAVDGTHGTANIDGTVNMNLGTGHSMAVFAGNLNVGKDGVLDVTAATDATPNGGQIARSISNFNGGQYGVINIGVGQPTNLTNVDTNTINDDGIIRVKRTSTNEGMNPIISMGSGSSAVLKGTFTINVNQGATLDLQDSRQQTNLGMIFVSGSSANSNINIVNPKYVNLQRLNTPLPSNGSDLIYLEGGGQSGRTNGVHISNAPIAEWQAANTSTAPNFTWMVQSVNSMNNWGTNASSGFTVAGQTSPQNAKGQDKFLYSNGNVIMAPSQSGTNSFEYNGSQTVNKNSNQGIIVQGAGSVNYYTPYLNQFLNNYSYWTPQRLAMGSSLLTPDSPVPVKDNALYDPEVQTINGNTRETLNDLDPKDGIKDLLKATMDENGNWTKTTVPVDGNVQSVAWYTPADATDWANIMGGENTPTNPTGNLKTTDTSAWAKVTYNDGSIDFAQIPLNITDKTNADIYTPSYQDASVKQGESVTTEAPTYTTDDGKAATAPAGTTYKIDDSFQAPAGATVTIDSTTGKITVNAGANTPVGEIDVPVTVTYPGDNTTDNNVIGKITVTASDANTYTPSYQDTTVKRGSDTTIPVTITGADGKTTTVPAGTQFKAGDFTTPDGATITVDSTSGEIKVTTKDNTPVGEVDIPVTVTYPDGSGDNTTAKVTISKNDADNYNPKYNPAKVNQGGKVETGVPSYGEGVTAPTGTTYKIPDGTTYPTGVTATIDTNNGNVTVTTSSNTPEGPIFVPVTVTYPDGSQDTIDAPIAVGSNTFIGTDYSVTVETNLNNLHETTDNSMYPDATSIISKITYWNNNNVRKGINTQGTVVYDRANGTGNLTGNLTGVSAEWTTPINTNVDSATSSETLPGTGTSTVADVNPAIKVTYGANSDLIKDTGNGLFTTQGGNQTVRWYGNAVTVQGATPVADAASKKLVVSPAKAGDALTDAEKALLDLSNLNKLDANTPVSYTWANDLKAGATQGTVKITFSDKAKDGQATYLDVELPAGSLNVGTEDATGKPIVTPQGQEPNAEQGIGNIPDLPTGTTYTWKDGEPDVSKIGESPVTVTVHYPDGNTQDVPTTIIVTGTEKPTDPKDPSQNTGNDETTLFKTVTRTIDGTTPDGKKVSDPQTVVFARTKTVTEQDGKAVTTYGDYKVFENGAQTDKTTGSFAQVDVPQVDGYTSQVDGNDATVIPANNNVTPGTADVTVNVTYKETDAHKYTPEGQDVHTNIGGTPEASKGIANIPSLPTGTTYTWKNGEPDTKTPGTKDAVVVVNYPDGSGEDVPVKVIVSEATPTPIVTPQGQEPNPEQGIGNVPDLPTGTTYTWKDGKTPDVSKIGESPITVTVHYPDGNTQDVPTTIIVTGTEKPTDPTSDDQKDLFKTVTRTIDGTTPDGKKVADPQTVVFARTKTVTEQDGKAVTTYGDYQVFENGAQTDKTTGSFAQVDVPQVDGYTSQVDGKNATVIPAVDNVTPDTENVTVNVTYNIDSETQQYQFVDKTNGKNVGQPISVKGDFGKQVPVSLTVPDNYKLADGQTLPTETPVLGVTNPVIKIYLDHKTADVTNDPSQADKVNKTITRTIDLDIAGKTSEYTKQTVTIHRTATEDLVTGDVTYSAWNVDGAKFKAVTAPEESGYTVSNPDAAPEVAVTGDTEDSTVTFVYGADEHSQLINYVDKDGNVIKHYDVTGKTGETVQTNVEKNVPNNWVIVGGQEITTSVTFGSNNPAPINVNIEHGTKDVTNDPSQADKVNKTVTRTIDLDIAGKTSEYTKQNVTLHRTATQDLVTGDVSYGAWNVDGAKFKAVAAPEEPGYTVTNPNAAPEVAVTGDTQDSTVTFNYTANDQTTTIKYVNNSDHNDVVGTKVVSGKTGETVNVTYTAPENWKIVAGQPTGETITFGSTPVEDTIVYVEHGTEDVTKTDADAKSTVTETINVTTPDGKTTPIVKSVTFNRTATKDLVTGKVTYGAWSDNGTYTFPSYTAPEEPGYTPSQNEVPAQTVKPGDKDLVFNITYSAGEHTQVINYVDKDGKLINTYNVTGKTGETVQTNVEKNVPKNWVIVGGQDITTSVTFGSDNPAPINVTIEHETEDVTKTDAGAKSTVTETINVTTPDGKTTPVVKSVTFNRTATKDLVTGKVTYGAWSDNGTYTFPSYTAPEEPGYTPSQNEVPAQTVKPGDKNLVFNITYSTNEQTRKIVFVDNGNTVGTQTLTGKTGTSVTIGDGNGETPLQVPTGYEVVPGTEIPTTVPFNADSKDNGDITVQVQAKKDTDDGRNDKGNKDVYREVTRTITVNIEGQVPQTRTQTLAFYRIKTTNEATGKVSYTDWTSNMTDGATNFPELAIPSAAGYTRTITGGTITTKDGKDYVASVSGLSDGTPVNDITVTVDYEKADQTRKIIFVDNGNTVGTQTLTGKTGTSVTIGDGNGETPLQVPTGYEVVPGTEIPTTVGFNATDNPDITVQVQAKVDTDDGRNDHGNKDVYREVTRTITVNMEGQAPQTGTQTLAFYRIKSTNEATGKVTYTDWTSNMEDGSTSFSDFGIPSAAGYTRTITGGTIITKDGKDYVAAQSGLENGEPVNNITVTVNYTYSDQTATIKYVNNADHNNVVGTQVVPGKTGETVNVTLEVPANWKVVDGQNIPSSFTFGSAPIKDTIVYVEHGTKDVTNDPSQADKVTKTITRTIDLDIAGKTSEYTKQTATIHRTATEDLVTGKVSYGAWNLDGAKFDKVTAPEKAGYTVTNPDAAPAMDVTGNTEDSTVTFTYTANEHSVTITYVDKNDKKVGGYTETGVTGETVDPQINTHVPNGYHVVGEYPTSITFGSSDPTPITVHVEENVNPTDADKYTPEPKDINTTVGKEPSAEEGIGNVPSLPTGTSYTWTNGEPDVSTPGTKSVEITVTYPDKSTDVVTTKVIVTKNPTDADKYTPVPQDINTTVGKEPNPEEGIGNIPSLPGGTSYTWTNGEPDVSTSGTKDVSITVHYPDGTTDTVTTTITVTEPSAPVSPVTPSTPDTPVTPETPSTPDDQTTSGSKSNDSQNEVPSSSNNTKPNKTKHSNTKKHGNSTTTSGIHSGDVNGESTSGVHAAGVGNGNGSHSSLYGNSNDAMSDKNAKTLPQTGAEANKAGLLGLAIASVGAILGLAGGKKKRKN